MKEKHLCMCCLSEECYKDMANEYFFGDDEKSEIYEILLLNTFNIKLPNSGNRCLICEDCVSRLREAAAFKDQCLEAQSAIRKKLSWSQSKANGVIVVPKVECEEYDDFDDKLSDRISDNYLLYTFYGSKTDQEVNQANSDDDDDRISTVSLPHVEIFENPEPNLPIITNVVSENNTLHTRKTIKPTVATAHEAANTRKRTVSGTKAKDSNLENKKVNCGKAKATQKSKQQIQHAEAEKWKNSESAFNSLKLLEHSNICLFRSHRPKYGCYLCSSKFFNIADLRAHNLTHTNGLKALTSRFNQLRGLSYRNVDISNLQCQLCFEPQKNLLDLAYHLKNNHEIMFKGKITDHFLIPYNLETFQCVLCGTSYNSFLRLSIHMNTHYANNVCETCGTTFINRLSLRAHRQMMHKEKKCKRCSAVFFTISDRVKHMRKVHNTQPNSKRHCLLCGKTFRYTYMLDVHKVEEHGAEKPVPLKCDDCGKSFTTSLGLRTHIRCVHLKERNYSCGICSMGFFTSTDQKRHERTHENQRTYSCSYCSTTFKSKDSWRRHLKRQHGHVFEPAYNKKGLESI